MMAARDLRRATIWSVVFEAVQPLIMIRRHVAKAVDRVHSLSHVPSQGPNVSVSLKLRGSYRAYLPASRLHLLLQQFHIQGERLVALDQSFEPFIDVRGPVR